jgi:hypothetical protein
MKITGLVLTSRPGFITYPNATYNIAVAWNTILIGPVIMSFATLCDASNGNHDGNNMQRTASPDRRNSRNSPTADTNNGSTGNNGVDINITTRYRQDECDDNEYERHDETSTEKKGLKRRRVIY